MQVLPYLIISNRYMLFISRALVKRITEIKTEDGVIMYYLMGDNRENSHDSRMFGWVPERLIAGKIAK